VQERDAASAKREKETLLPAAGQRDGGLLLSSHLECPVVWLFRKHLPPPSLEPHSVSQRASALRQGYAHKKGQISDWIGRRRLRVREKLHSSSSDGRR